MLRCQRRAPVRGLVVVGVFYGAVIWVVSEGAERLALLYIMVRAAVLGAGRLQELVRRISD